MARIHVITDVSTIPPTTTEVPFTPEEETAADAAETYVAPTSPYLYATAQILVANADVASMSISSQLSGAFRFDVGQYWMFFTDEQPDTQYMALAYDSGAVRTFVREADKFTGYFIVSVTDFSSVPTDPDAINLEIKRVQ